jgi:hypothetical protein
MTATTTDQLDGVRVTVRQGCRPPRTGTVICRVGWITYAVRLDDGENGRGACGRDMVTLIEPCVIGRGG